MILFDVRSARWFAALVVAATAIGCGDSSSTSVGSDAGDAGDGAARSRSCPMPTSQIVPGAVCAVDPAVACPGPYGPAACAACELFALPCTCASGTWACDDQATLQCNRQRCPMDAGVDARDAADQ